MGVDINAKMLKIAKTKAKRAFLKGDMRTSRVGAFDAVLTIFNAIGHLTRADFKKTLQNVHKNIKKGGLYLFDIFNLDYLLAGNNITKLTIDWQEIVDGITKREVQHSTISESGVLASYDIYYEQKGRAKPKITKASQSLQTYTAEQLREMLRKAGFRTLDQCDVDGTKFIENQSERIFTIAQKI